MGGYLIIVLLLALVGVLAAGVILMGIGGEKNRKYGNRLMSARVTLQGALLLGLAAMFFAGKS